MSKNYLSQSPKVSTTFDAKMTPEKNRLDTEFRFTQVGTPTVNAKTGEDSDEEKENISSDENTSLNRAIDFSPKKTF